MHLSCFLINFFERTLQNTEINFQICFFHENTTLKSSKIEKKIITALDAKEFKYSNFIKCLAPLCSAVKLGRSFACYWLGSGLMRN